MKYAEGTSRTGESAEDLQCFVPSGLSPPFVSFVRCFKRVYCIPSYPAKHLATLHTAESQSQAHVFASTVDNL